MMPAFYLGFYLEVITLENISFGQHTILEKKKKELFRIHIQREKLQISKFKTLPTWVVVQSQQKLTAGCYLMFSSRVKTKFFKNCLLLLKD